MTVVEGQGAIADVLTDAPLSVKGRGHPVRMIVYYGNSGDSDLPAPLIIINGTEDASGEPTYLGFSGDAMNTNSIQLLGRSLEGPPGFLRPQQYDSCVMYFEWGNLGVDAYAITADSTRPLTDGDWQWIENGIRPYGVPDDAWASFWTNFKFRVGLTWGDYVRFLEDFAEAFPTETRDVRSMVSALYSGSAPNMPSFANFQATASLSGTLLGALDNQPQAGVQIGVYPVSTNESTPLAGSAITDTNGQFVITGLFPGQYAYALAGSQCDAFDMDRDGAPDNSPPMVAITNADVTGQNLLAFQSNPTNAPANSYSGSDATLALDSQGVLHAFWSYGNSLWHACLAKGNWVDASVISSNYAASYAVASAPNLDQPLQPGHHRFLERI